jgi:phosphatidylinositol glycan class A protein
MGGVEMHQYFLAQGLLQRGHKVILITGCYESQRFGVRYMTNGLKVYYCPVYPLVAQASPPNFYSFFPLFRNIMIREKIQIVHGHQTTSFLAHECILHAKTMGLKAVFTDHSLFGFADPASIHVNKFMKFTLSDVDHVICVSHTSKENLCLRAYLDPRQVSVIPNAIDPTQFTPNPDAAPSLKEKIVVVIVSRLVYRKGMDARKTSTA